MIPLFEKVTSAGSSLQGTKRRWLTTLAAGNMGLLGGYNATCLLADTWKWNFNAARLRHEIDRASFCTDGRPATVCPSDSAFLAVDARSFRSRIRVAAL